MEIYINGRQLHVAKGDVTLNWSNIRFSEAVADEWSTEIELPNDPYNIDLLDCYGLLDRGPIYNHRVDCSVLIDDIAKDGYLQVLSIDENIIKARVYILVIPYAILDKKVSDYYPHEDVVFRWDRFSPITTNIAGIDEGIIPYDYTETDFYSNIMAQWHSSVNVQKILQNIENAENITLPAVYNTLYQLSARKKVCPSNPRQVFQIMKQYSGSINNEVPLEMAGGQHITNDFVSSWSYADFVWLPDFSNWDYQLTNFKWLENCEKKDRITFNRDCSAHIKIYAVGTDGGASIQPKLNNAQLRPWRFVPDFTTSSWTLNDILLYDFTEDFHADDVFELKLTSAAPLDSNRLLISIVVEYSDYEWNEDDYDVDLVYIPAPFMIWYAWHSLGGVTYDQLHDFSGNGDGTHSAADYSFTYFGAYTNLDRDITVRDYLTSLCWIHNQKLHLDRNELIFQHAMTKKEVVANITQIDPSNDKLGQLNKIGYRETNNPTKFEIDNEFLDLEKGLHENAFYSADIIPQYSYDMSYSENANSSGEHWITDINVNYDDLSPVIMTATQDGDRYWLKKAPDIAGFGLPALRNAQTIKGQTLTDISDTDFVAIDGHKYMLVDGNIDMNTYITEFTAIQCDSVFDLIPQVVITHIYTSGTSADVEYTVTGIFIQGTTLTIYSNEELTNVVAVIEGTNVDTQIQSVTGLTPDTFYWAVVTATDAQDNEGESTPRKFRTADYEFSGRVSYTNDYDTLSANVNVTCQGATFTEVGIQFSTTPDFSEDIITGSTTSPVNNTFDDDIEGFSANTLYYYRYFATSDYGTQIYVPDNNTITTKYAPPVLTITEVGSTPNSLTLSFLYEGDYPYDGYYSCVIGLTDDSEQPIPIDLDNLQPNRPEVVTVSGLQVGSEYVVSWDVNYYEDEVSAIEYFTTQAHNFDFTTNLDSYSDTTARITTIATQVTIGRLTIENIGINLGTSPDFLSERDMGGNLGYGDYGYRLNKTGLTEHTVYYYRPWIETTEFGREYGPTASFETLYSMPTVTITEASVSYDSITVSVDYTGNYPVPQNGVLYLEQGGVVLQRLDASRLRPNDDTIFTFTGLDELTTYTIRYAGDYYVQREAITDSITATTGERINITCVTAWAVNGQATHTITVNSYEAIDTFNCTFNNSDITMVDDWALNGSTIEGVSTGYDYNENPYTLEVEVTIGGGYTVTRTFEFNVLYENLTVKSISTNLVSSRPTAKGIYAFIRKLYTDFRYDFDYSECLLTLTEVTTGDVYTQNYIRNGENGSNWTIWTGIFDLPAGTYTTTHKLTNVVRQTVTTTPTSNVTWEGAVLKNVSVTAATLGVTPYYNTCYDPSYFYLELCDANGNVLQTFNPSLSGVSVSSTGLTPATEYIYKAYFSPDDDPVTRTVSTAAIVSTQSVTNITATTATINITFR